MGACPEFWPVFASGLLVVLLLLPMPLVDPLPLLLPIPLVDPLPLLPRFGSLADWAMHGTAASAAAKIAV